MQAENTTAKDQAATPMWQANPPILTGPDNYGEWLNAIMLIATCSGWIDYLKVATEDHQDPGGHAAVNLLMFSSISPSIKQYLHGKNWNFKRCARDTLDGINDYLTGDHLKENYSPEITSMNCGDFSSLFAYISRVKFLQKQTLISNIDWAQFILLAIRPKYPAWFDTWKEVERKRGPTMYVELEQFLMKEAVKELHSRWLQ